MTKIRHSIYLDMDGVFCDFDLGVEQMTGKKLADYPRDEDLHEAVRKVNRFWHNIPPMNEGFRLMAYIVEKYDFPTILTASSNWDRERCIEGKNYWFTKYLPHWPRNKIHIVRRSEKKNYAYFRIPNVLIDDFHINTTEWTEAGGIAHLYKSFEQARDWLDDVMAME